MDFVDSLAIRTSISLQDHTSFDGDLSAFGKLTVRLLLSASSVISFDSFESFLSVRAFARLGSTASMDLLYLPSSSNWLHRGGV